MQYKNEKLVFKTEEEANKFMEEHALSFLEDDKILYIAPVLDENNFKDYVIEIGIKKEKGESDFEQVLLTIDDMKSSAKPKRQQSKLVNDSHVKFIDEIEPLSITKLKIRPLISGTAMNSEKSRNKNGTIGMFFKIDRKLERKEIFFITNYHNLSGSLKPEESDLVFQPNNDYHDYKNFIGNYVEGQYHDSEGTSDFTLDYALVRLNENAVEKIIYQNVDYDLSNQKIYNTELTSPGFINNDKDPPRKSILKGLDEPRNNMEVKFHGATTVIGDKGKIRSVNAMVKVTDIFNKKSKKVFKSQILTDNVCNPGDSGSILVNTLNKVVGLIHAGNTNGVCIANNINQIFCDHTTGDACDENCTNRIKLKEILT